MARKKSVSVTAACVALWLWAVGPAARTDYELPVFPAEHKRMADPETGAELTFLTTHSARDTNLYFHERSWLADGSVILFYSSREEGGLMGYLVRTGELVRFITPTGPLRGATAAVNRPGLYAVRGQEIVELSLRIAHSEDPVRSASKVMVSERVICTPSVAPSTFLNENCDGTLLAYGVHGTNAPEGPLIQLVDVASGAVRDVCRLPASPGYGGHVQWSRTNPNLLSFAGRPQRLMVVDIRDGHPRNVYRAREGELVTHESWWVHDQLMFCGGTQPKPSGDSHVKLLNLTSGEVRIVGPGAWWPGATAEALAKVNWWHATGSDNGRWVAADNWHGDIMLFEGKTTRPRLLTTGHRTYGRGEHPHVAWDREGKAVVFTSEKLGNADVCIATIPDAWQKETPS